ncbi:hypothetical protein BJY04DRAFT_216326 [Aspergillus karnatakaensis]|uniref:uncharacterized protein n=1 Tax=Aspergillus karnatakaensis TaxID=1810916 RepID=UPI003CCDB94B
MTNTTIPTIFTDFFGQTHNLTQELIAEPPIGTLTWLPPSTTQAQTQGQGFYPPPPPIGSQSAGIDNTELTMRKASGKVTKILDFQTMVWAAPDSAASAETFTPVWDDDLVDQVLHSWCRASSTKVGDCDWGLYLRDDGVVMFGKGVVTGVWEGVWVAIVDSAT